MPFKKTDEGWEYDPKGEGRIPSPRRDIFADRPPVRDTYTGHPIGKDGEIDWKKVIDEANKRGVTNE